MSPTSKHNDVWLNCWVPVQKYFQKESKIRSQEDIPSSQLSNDILDSGITLKPH